MNRQKAIETIYAAVGSHGDADRWVSALEALGLLKFDEPAPAKPAWKVGDVVLLRSGSPKMTVIGVTRGSAKTEWSSASGHSFNSVYPFEALVAWAELPEPAVTQFRAASDGSLWVRAAACLGEVSGEYHCIAANRPEPSNVIVNEIAMIKALRIAGYEVTKRHER